MTPAAGAKETLKRVPGLVPIVRSGRDARTVVRRKAYDARFAAGRFRRDPRIGEYLRARDVRKLQLGTGSNPMDGWLNTDVADYCRRNEVVYLDARRPFPLPDSSFDLVFSEHMIEHLTCDPRLAGLERHMRSVAEFNALETIALEARRPAPRSS